MGLEADSHSQAETMTTQVVASDGRISHRLEMTEIVIALTIQAVPALVDQLLVVELLVSAPRWLGVEEPAEPDPSVWMTKDHSTAVISAWVTLGSKHSRTEH
jgi:hypothetical protein